MLRSAEISYRSNKPTNAKSSKEFWWLVKSFQGNNKCSTIGPVKSPSNSLLTNNLSKANEFNSYFVNICSTLVNSDNSSALDLSTQPVNHIHRITPTLQPFPVNKELLSYCFKNYIKVGKACGPDKNHWQRTANVGWSSFITFLILPKRTLMIACFHHNGRQHRFTIFIKGKYLRLWKLLSYFTSEYTR